MSLPVNGWIILDKPSGITSAHAVAKVKRLLRPKKIGHAGTLDPLASGVLPLALGEATKTIPYMMDADKEYAFTVTWGEERDTDDSLGKIVKKCEKIPEKMQLNAKLNEIMPHFIGKIMQLPPAYSALKVDGQRAYDLARNGTMPELKPREVRVDSLIIVGEPAPTADFLCKCGKGTYIRSLARDMGRELGCFGHISRLRRIRVGKFGEAQAISLANLEEMVHKGNLGFLHPVAAALDDIPAVDITEPQAASLRRGQNVVFPYPTETPVILARSHGIAVALCEGKAGVLKPVRVFNV